MENTSRGEMDGIFVSCKQTTSTRAESTRVRTASRRLLEFNPLTFQIRFLFGSITKLRKIRPKTRFTATQLTGQPVPRCCPLSAPPVCAIRIDKPKPTNECQTGFREQLGVLIKSSFVNTILITEDIQGLHNSLLVSALLLLNRELNSDACKTAAAPWWHRRRPDLLLEFWEARSRQHA